MHSCAYSLLKVVVIMSFDYCCYPNIIVLMIVIVRRLIAGENFKECTSRGT